MNKGYRWERRIKKFCGDAGHKCEHHNGPCMVSMKFKRGDTRTKKIKEAVKMSGWSHNAESAHLCSICFQEMSERREFGYYQKDPIDNKIKPPHLMGKLIPEQHG